MPKQPSHSSRRRFMSGAAAALPVLLGVEAARHHAAELGAQREPVRPLKVLCVGAHPDDPESGCGGTLARYAAARHQVAVIYLTRGEAGIKGKSHDEAAAIRTGEAEAACKILGAKPLFAGQIDGATEVNPTRTQAFLELLSAEAPDVVFTHWPIDTHPDHQAASLLTLRAYLRSPRRFSLYFFEVNSGSQTLGFVPTAYVDITATRDKKKQALFAHKSQGGEGIYGKHHGPMEDFRGREAGAAAAEAFAQLARDSRSGRLPGLEPPG
jgi:LmbE family N-acetylglucosaminyl deacetylase